MKSFVIGIEGIPASMDQVSKTLESAKQYGYQCEWFKAHTGITADVLFKEDGVFFPTTCPPLISAFQFNYTITRWLTRQGARGCLASHYTLWKRCIELNEDIIILEQDGIFLREWDDSIVYRDVLHLDPIGGRHNDAWRVLHDASDGIHDFKYNSIKTGERMAGAHAYAIKPHAAKILLDYGFEHGFLNTDTHINWNKVSIESIKPGVCTMQETGNTVSLTASLI